MDALLELLFELLPLGFSGVKGPLLLGFSGGSSFKGSLFFNKNDLVFSFSLSNGSLDSLVYRSLLLFLEVFGGDGPKLEQVALVVSLLCLVLLFKFIPKPLLSLSSFFQLCF